MSTKVVLRTYEFSGIPEETSVRLDWSHKGRLTVILEGPGERDVTAECTAELRQSRATGGHYVMICHGDKKVIALGLDDNRMCEAQPGFRVERVPRATISFRIIKLEKDCK